MSNDDRWEGDERPAVPAETDGEPEMTEGVGGVPDLPESERATVGDADDVNVDTDEPQVEPNRS